MSPTPNVNTAPIQGNTLALFNAIRNGRMDVIEVLLNNNPNWINSRNQGGQTPLHFAVSVDNIEIVKYLIKRGANINDKDRNGVSPLRHAIENGQTEMAICLIEFGADVNETEINGGSLLFLAKQKLAVIADMLVEYGAKDNYKSPFKSIFDAAIKGSVRDIAYFIDGGADINAKDNGGMKLFYLAARVNNNIAVLQ